MLEQFLKDYPRSDGAVDWVRSAVDAYREQTGDRPMNVVLGWRLYINCAKDLSDNSALLFSSHEDPHKTYDIRLYGVLGVSVWADVYVEHGVSINRLGVHEYGLEMAIRAYRKEMKRWQHFMEGR